METDEFVMVHPSYFAVLYDINPYMGGDVDKQNARDQWQSVREQLIDAGATVHTVRPDEVYQETEQEELPSSLPDIVFAANHGAFINEDTFLRATLSQEERKGEHPYIEHYIDDLFENVEIQTTEYDFEGYGDVYRDHHSEVLWLGYGIRSEYEYTERFADDDYEVIPLELTNEWFYHLDTCLFSISDDTILVEDGAFTQTSIDKIQEQYSNVVLLSNPGVEKPSNEHFMPCNSVKLPDGTILTTPENKNLFEHTVGVDESQMRYVDVSEFHKAGGSIRCMLLPIDCRTETE